MVEYLGVYQIIGGCIGLFLSLKFILKSAEIPLHLQLIFIPVITLYSYSIISGILIFKNKNLGIIHSMANQSLQLLSFSLFGFAFQFYSGLAIKLTWVLTESAFPYLNFGISSWEFRISDDAGIRTIGLNIIPVIFLLYIMRQRKLTKEGHLKKQILELGS
jgi:hypothetical protein